MHICQRDCQMMSAQTDFLELLEKGTELKIGSKQESTKKGACTLVRWFQGVADAVDELGLDTIFHIPDVTCSSELNILKH